MSSMPDFLDIEELHIPIICNHSNRKTLAITITQQGDLLIKAPFGISDKEIERFLVQKRYWIYKQTKRVLKDASNRIYRSAEEVKELREQARRMLTDKTDYYKDLVGVNYQRIRIGAQKTRWGSCSTRGTISYNWHLILMPESIINYVVVHELCHLLEMNHSKKFWSKVGEILPDYSDSRRWLKEHGSQYL